MKLALWIFFAGVLLFGVGALGWIAADLPPVSLVVRHGFPPAGGPTGREKVIEEVRFVEIGTGYFRMGSWFHCTKGDTLGRICKVFRLPWGQQPVEKGREVPIRWVEIREPYWIAVTELTNAQYERFDPEHERTEWSPDDDSPVLWVSEEDVRSYCEWLSKRTGLAVRLPSEAEWENACRCSSMSEYCIGDDESKLGEYAWSIENSGGRRAHAVGMKRPNAWGLYDLHGNVWEWCADRWHADYNGAPEDARPWTEGGEQGFGLPLWVIRGPGYRNYAALGCRSAFRDYFISTLKESDLGFRPCLGPLDR